jgi:hypothetical protein
MNLRRSNQLNMIGSCINIANSPDYKPAWFGKDPADFGTDLATLSADYASTTAKAALAESAGGGAADLKAVAETTLEDAAHVLARALANHFKKTGDLERLAKVNVTKSNIVKLRDQELVAKGTEIRDIASHSLDEENAGKRGVTAERIAALNNAIAAFSVVMNSPRGQIVNRSTLLKEVETDTADLIEQASDMDDLVLQLKGSEAGERFIEAWKRARTIIDVGHRSEPEEPAVTAAPVVAKAA